MIPPEDEMPGWVKEVQTARMAFAAVQKEADERLGPNHPTEGRIYQDFLLGLNSQFHFFRKTVQNILPHHILTADEPVNGFGKIIQHYLPGSNQIHSAFFDNRGDAAGLIYLKPVEPSVSQLLLPAQSIEVILAEIGNALANGNPDHLLSFRRLRVNLDALRIKRNCEWLSAADHFGEKLRGRVNNVAHIVIHHLGEGVYPESIWAGRYYLYDDGEFTADLRDRYYFPHSGRMMLVPKIPGRGLLNKGKKIPDFKSAESAPNNGWLRTTTLMNDLLSL